MYLCYNFWNILTMRNTKNKTKLNIHSQKWILNSFIIPLEGIERIHYIKFFNRNFVVFFNISIRIVIFDSLFNYEKHYLFHRLLFFIRAVYLPTSIVCRGVGVGYKSCNVHATALYRQ